jgi:hypothetical protein
MESVDTAFLLLPEGIVLQSVHPTTNTVVVQIACRDIRAACPRCEQPSERVHVLNVNNKFLAMVITAADTDHSAGPPPPTGSGCSRC